MTTQIIRRNRDALLRNGRVLAAAHHRLRARRVIRQRRIQIAAMQRFFALGAQAADSQRAAALRQPILQHHKLAHEATAHFIQLFQLEHESIDEMTRRDRPQLFRDLWNFRERFIFCSQLYKQPIWPSINIQLEAIDDMNRHVDAPSIGAREARFPEEVMRPKARSSWPRELRRPPVKVHLRTGTFPPAMRLNE